jgi:ADP-ribose pyrophosphatase
MGSPPIKSETIYEARVFRLCRETVALPNGVTTTVDVIHHPGSCAIVPILPDDRVIMTKQYRHSLRAFLWEIPAGTLDPLVCARRELMEEAGYRAKRLEKLTEIITAPGYCDERITIFLATGLEPVPQNLDQDEVLEVVPLPLCKTLDMIKEGAIQDAMSIIGLFLVWTHRQTLSAAGAGGAF